MTADREHILPPPADDPEPRAERSPVPIALIVVFALLFYWGMVYANDHGGGFDSRVYEPYRDFLQVTEVQPPGNPIEESTKRGKAIFSVNCASCHQETGMGSPVNNCPPLVGSDWLVGVGPNRPIRLVIYGGQGPITVLGKLYDPGATAMTPFGSTLTDQQLADVLNFVRNNWGNKGDYVPVEKVTEIRAKEITAGWSGPRHAPELLKYPDKD